MSSSSDRRDHDVTATLPDGLDSTVPIDAADAGARLSPVSSATRVAGRYRLRLPLGSGGHGAVWEAEDELTRRIVAVKLLNPGFSGNLARVRQEIAALRLLRLPGVVRLLDEGLDQDRTFLVMERVSGLPFPGATPRPCPWSELSGTTIALLETLARVHATGIVHRDLKPGNVLVTADGRPMLLDFGISHFQAPGREALTLRDEVIGTPAYLAPEQFSSDPVTARTDLFALGLMLYEALSGQLPHAGGGGVWRLLRARLTEPAPPLAGAAPWVPAEVAAVIDAMLRITPGDRPRSAAAVLGMLQGAPELSVSPLPRFGPDGPLRTVVDAALHGRSVQVVGPPGSGRSRCLADAAARLERRGRRVLRTTGSMLPLGSLEPALGALGGDPGAREVAVQRIAELLATGAVLVVDDAEWIDPATAATLARCRAAGAILEGRVEPPEDAPGDPLVVRLGPVPEQALRALFAGPDRLLHLQEDAARALWARTEGLPSRVADELTSWVRAGLAQWEGDRLVIDRDAIDRLEAGLRTTTAPSPELDHDADLLELLGWIELAARHAQVSLLARVLDLSAAQVEERVARLVACGAVRASVDGRLIACTDALERWPEEQRQTARLALATALPPGAPERLLHLVGASDPARPDHASAVAGVAAEVARRLESEGKLGKAALAIGEGLRMARAAAGRADREIEGLLELWVEIGLLENRPSALDRVLYEVHRTEPRTPAVAHLEQLVRSALAALGNAGEQALATASAVPSHARGSLELLRQALRVRASRLCSEAAQAAVLSDAPAWAPASRGPPPPAPRGPPRRPPSGRRTSGTGRGGSTRPRSCTAAPRRAPR